MQFVRVKLLGQGAYGKAYLAHLRDEPSKQVVVKQVSLHGLSKKGTELAIKEAQVLQILNHPCIIKHLEHFQEGENLFIVTELAECGDLQTAIGITRQKRRFFDEAIIWKWYLQICCAIKHVHDRKILHRDIKTANMFLRNNMGPSGGSKPEECMIKLGDFGVSKILESTFDCAETMIGTLYNMSPELLQGQLYNNKSDIWAVGCVLYELSTLKKPFDGSHQYIVQTKILNGSYAPLQPHCSPALKNTVEVLLQRNPDDRPDVNSLLATPPLRSRLAELSMIDLRILQIEFSHTVLHGINANVELSQHHPRQDQMNCPQPHRGSPYNRDLVPGPARPPIAQGQAYPLSPREPFRLMPAAQPVCIAKSPSNASDGTPALGFAGRPASPRPPSALGASPAGSPGGGMGQQLDGGWPARAGRPPSPRGLATPPTPRAAIAVNHPRSAVSPQASGADVVQTPRAQPSKEVASPRNLWGGALLVEKAVEGVAAGVLSPSVQPALPSFQVAGQRQQARAAEASAADRGEWADRARQRDDGGKLVPSPSPGAWEIANAPPAPKTPGVADAATASPRMLGPSPPGRARDVMAAASPRCKAVMLNDPLRLELAPPGSTRHAVAVPSAGVIWWEEDGVSKNRGYFQSPPPSRPRSDQTPMVSPTSGLPSLQDMEGAFSESMQVSVEKLVLNDKTLKLPGVADGDTRNFRIESLRVFLEENMGTQKFLSAYKLFQSYQGDVDQEEFMMQLLDCVGMEKAQYLPLIHQLIMLEDREEEMNKKLKPSKKHQRQKEKYQ